MDRRQYVGSLKTTYGTNSIYDYDITAPDTQILASQGNHMLTQLNAIKDTTFSTYTDTETIADRVIDLNDKCAKNEKTAITATRTDCASSCSGLCYTQCTTGCRGTCVTNCALNCADGCTNSCHQGCSDSCAIDCDNGCNNNCGTQCSIGCTAVCA